MQSLGTAGGLDEPYTQGALSDLYCIPCQGYHRIRWTWQEIHVFNLWASSYSRPWAMDGMYWSSRRKRTEAIAVGLRPAARNSKIL